MTDFAALGLSPALLTALAAEGHTTPTPIQAQTIPSLLEGRDVLGLAQTGTGKTAAFALPLLHRLEARRRRPPGKSCFVLILAPTRELASQIEERIRAYGRNMPISSMTVFGGVGMGPQIRTLARGVDIVVATPGRLMDHMSTGAVRLNQVEALVLDEVDQMLDLGFMPAIRKIVAAIPPQRQTLLFSATMPKEIAGLADDLLRDPLKVSVVPASTPAERIEQRVVVLPDPQAKRRALVKLLSAEGVERTLVFTRTKHGADKVAKHLGVDGIPCAAIHGEKSQGQRERALADFKTGRIKVLVATDIAARGIDVAGVTHVINADLPAQAETYVHRIGRTGRAGAEGEAISLMVMDELPALWDIEKVIQRRVPAVDMAGATMELPERPARRALAPKKQGGGRGNGGGRPGGFGKPNGGNASQGRPPRREGGHDGRREAAYDPLGDGTARSNSGRDGQYAKPAHAGKPAHGKPSHGKPAHGGQRPANNNGGGDNRVRRPRAG
ncbi:DEAD/DEAH box helicase [Lacibacterium aquatile]|uniref:DEAD/DEAH box helicase n=1 Tax=Lacibacterium aquatile TaxID=1168082 RepID=A0ABW5DVN4_9PROT